MSKKKLKLEHKLAFGGVAIGNGFEEVSDERAQETLEAAWDAGIRQFDTSPMVWIRVERKKIWSFFAYKNRDEYVLSSKVGRILKSQPGKMPETMWVNPAPFDYKYDYSAEAVRRSVEDSLQRLGVERLDYVFIHDLSPDHNEEYEDGVTWLDHFEVAKNGAMPELTKMREEGIIKGWGLGVNTIEPILKTIEVADPDIFLSAIQYSMVDHKDSIDRLFPAISREQSCA